MMRFRIYWIAFLVSGCVAYQDVDPETSWDPQANEIDYDGEPALELGFYSEQLYTLLEDGDTCPVVHGLQGGTWTMPAIKTLGVTPMAWVTCSLVTDNGEEVGGTGVRSQFFRGTESYFEIQSFPVPIFRTGDGIGEPVDALFGEMAQLTCSALGDDGVSVSYSVRVQIIDG